MRSIKPVHVVVGLLVASFILAVSLRSEATLMAFIGACVLTALYSFGEVIRQLFKDARWLVHRIAQRLKG